MNNKIDFNLNFGGFYESMHSYNIDNAIAYHYDVDSIDGVEDKDIDNVDYTKMQTEYAEQWLNEYNTITGLGLTYNGITSPSYYNFETDTINATINVEVVGNLINAAEPELINYINEASQSCDGFASFYEGFDKVLTNKAVFMTYYTDWLTSHNKEDVDYIGYECAPGVELVA